VESVWCINYLGKLTAINRLEYLESLTHSSQSEDLAHMRFQINTDSVKYNSCEQTRNSYKSTCWSHAQSCPPSTTKHETAVPKSNFPQLWIQGVFKWEGESTCPAQSHTAADCLLSLPGVQTNQSVNMCTECTKQPVGTLNYW